MSAIRLLETGQQEKIGHLREQLIAGGMQKEELPECAERFLAEIGIFDATLIEEENFRSYKKYLKESNQFTVKQINAGTSALRRIQKYWVEKNYGELLNEIQKCNTAEKQFKGNIIRFLIRQGICHIKEISYSLRERYEMELLEARDTDAALRYLKAFDRIKQYDIREEMKTLLGQARNRLHFDNQILFLLYHPDQDLAMEFDKVRDKQELVWDFKQKAAETLKSQVFTILMFILDNMREDPKDRKVRFLLPLQWLYQFCIQEQIEDIERLELQQINAFEQIVAGKVVNYKNSMQIVDNCRKILFLNADEIHWHANVWYMERFHLSWDRINPSNPVQRMSFHEVTNCKNRELLQDFAKYQVGITNLTIGNIRSQHYYIKRFMQYFKHEKSICNVSASQVDEYFKELKNEDIKAETVNRAISHIFKIYVYLKVNGHIAEIPFDPEYHMQTTYPVHHDRSVEAGTCSSILYKLQQFPEVERLIFLNLWGTGLRLSEVCTLKGNAYWWDGEDAWIKVYQIKMKVEKMIPIPLILYKIMQIYIEKHNIKPNKFIFQAKAGGAFRVGTFTKSFKTYCAKHQIDVGDYIFKSHDYRHTLATEFYDNGVSIQTVRDYLGHTTENMTKQYIDYMPKKIAKANEDYFEKPENSLALLANIKKCGE